MLLWLCWLICNKGCDIFRWCSLSGVRGTLESCKQYCFTAHEFIREWYMSAYPCPTKLNISILTLLNSYGISMKNRIPLDHQPTANLLYCNCVEFYSLKKFQFKLIHSWFYLLACFCHRYIKSTEIDRDIAGLEKKQTV